MHVDESTTKERLGRLVQSITSNLSLWDDLLQEAMIHLWLMEDIPDVRILKIHR